MSKHVAVLMGGWSSERPVSLSSGNACADALEAGGLPRHPRRCRPRHRRGAGAALKPDVAFNALHGPFGEDGCIQGILEILAIPYTHSGVLASALAMNKPKAKDVMKAAGIPVAESLLVSRFEAAKAHVMAPPYVVKPPNEGSSFGVLIVREDATHPPQELFSDDWPYGDMVMVERYVGGRELTCAVRGDEPLDVIDILTEGRFYDYDAKYADRRIKTRSSGQTFTKYLPKCTDAGATGPSGFGLPWGQSRGLPLRRPARGDGRARLPRGQHAARHDGDVAGSGNGRVCRHGFPRAGALDGGGRVVQAVGTGDMDGDGEDAPVGRRVDADASSCRASCAGPVRRLARLELACCRAMSGIKGLAAALSVDRGRRRDCRRSWADRRLGGHDVVRPRASRRSRSPGRARPPKSTCSPASASATYPVDASPSMSMLRAPRIEALPWVEQATIRKLYPDTLKVAVVERERLRHLAARRPVLADRPGRHGRSPSEIGERYARLPLVVGDGAEKRAGEFVSIVDGVPSPEAADQGRRAGLRAGAGTSFSTNGVEILLPQDDPGAALVQVVALDDEPRHPVARYHGDRPSSCPTGSSSGSPKPARRRASRCSRSATRLGKKGRRTLMKLFGASESGCGRLPRRPTIVSVLDVGSSKICCLIARLTPREREADDALRGRTHSIEVLGIGHQRSRGIKSGVVANLDAAEQAIRLAVDAAERMAGVTVESLIVNVSCGRLASETYSASVDLAGQEVGRGRDIGRVLAAGRRHSVTAGPLGRPFAADRLFARRRRRHRRSARHGRRSASASTCTWSPPTSGRSAISNSASIAATCRSRRWSPRPMRAASSVLVDDEAELGCACIDFGGGTTTIAVFIERPVRPCRRHRRRRPAHHHRHRPRPVDPHRGRRAAEDDVRQRARRRLRRSRYAVGAADRRRRRATCPTRCRARR